MKIHAIQTGTVAITTNWREGVGHGRRRLVNTLLDREWTEPLPIYAFAIEHPEGVIVVKWRDECVAQNAVRHAGSAVLHTYFSARGSIPPRPPLKTTYTPAAESLVAAARSSPPVGSSPTRQRHERSG